MNFIRSDPDESYPINHILSENGVWEFGIRTVLFGFRVSAGVVGEGCYSIDYCCADDAAWLIQVAAIVFAILEMLPESTPSWEAEKLFSRQQRKLMVNDPECWDQLTKLLNQLPGAIAISSDAVGILPFRSPKAMLRISPSNIDVVT